MRFVDLVATSAEVAGASGRLDKIGRLASLLARLDPDEIEAAVAFLSGGTRQGRIGVGHAAIAAASDVAPAQTTSLAVQDVDAAFGALALIGGKGSAAERARSKACWSRRSPERHEWTQGVSDGRP